MKIHTTQNLDLSANKKLLGVNQQSLSFYDLRFDSAGVSQVNSEDAVSFKKRKKPNEKDVKKIIDTAKKGLEDIKDKATPEVKKGDKFLMSSFFDFCTDLVNKNENIFNAAAAAIICIILRPLTIAALPTKKADSSNKNTSAQEKNGEISDKEFKPSFKGKKKSKEYSVEKTNNIYAICQSVASGIMGIATAILVTAPFKKGSDLVTRNLHKYLSPESIKKLYPWVDEASIKLKDGTINPIEKWKNVNDGRQFKSDIKNCDMLPKFKKLFEVSKETFEKILGIKNVDWAAQKGKSFNDVVTKDGKKIYDVIDFDKIGIKVSEEGFDDAQILLKDFDKEYLEKLIADSKGINEWGNLNIESVYDEKGFVKDFRQWKDLNGKNWKLDLDNICVTSELETADYKPRISGKKRFDTKDNEYKFVAYQINGENGRLGSEITTDMVNADRSNADVIKFITWFPDLVARVPIATLTIALIPYVLKNVFGIEKAKPQPAPVAFKGNIVQDNNISKDANQVSFKAGKPPKKPSFLSEFIAKYIGKPFIESPTVRKIVDFINKIPGESTEHYVVLGSIIQSGVYVNRTLKDKAKAFDEDRKKTLAFNQALCCIIPTIAGYIVNKRLKDKVVKKIGYRYSGKMKNEIAELKSRGLIEKANEISGKLDKKIKAVGTLANLVSLTLMYRYLTPVLVTPIANKIGDKHIAKKKAKEQAKLENL